MTQWDALIIGAFIVAILITAAILASRAAWKRIDERMTAMLAEAIARPIPTRFRDWDAEMQALVAAEQSRGDD